MGSSDYRYYLVMEPASNIISSLGGPSVVAQAVGVHRTRVSMWQAPREKGGTNGLIPYRHVPKLLEFAKSRGVDLKPGDFMPTADTAA